jgi:hypothetical protein
MIVLAPGVAQAAFEPKTQRDPLSRQAVERGLILPKGWVEFEFEGSRKHATSSWGADGAREQWNNSAWTYNTGRLTMSLGYGQRAEVWASLPYHRARLDHFAVGATDTDWSISDQSIGDPRFGWRFELLDNPAPRASAIVEVAYKGPLGAESSGSFIGGPLNISGFVFTTGTPDLYAGAAYKRQFGPAAITARAGYARRFSGPVQYLIELENSQFIGRIKPGDLLTADLGAQLQLGPAALGVNPRFTYRGETRMGTTSPGMSPNKTLRAVSGSDGFNLDVMADAVLNVSPALDLSFYANVPVAGQDLQFFPIEDLHPTAGTTLGGKVEVRY